MFTRARMSLKDVLPHRLHEFSVLKRPIGVVRITESTHFDRDNRIASDFRLDRARARRDVVALDRNRTLHARYPAAMVAESNNGHHSRMNLDSCRFVGPSDR
jgi:hypothetical protein